MISVCRNCRTSLSVGPRLVRMHVRIRASWGKRGTIARQTRDYRDKMRCKREENAKDKVCSRKRLPSFARAQRCLSSLNFRRIWKVVTKEQGSLKDALTDLSHLQNCALPKTWPFTFSSVVQVCWTHARSPRTMNQGNDTKGLKCYFNLGSGHDCTDWTTLTRNNKANKQT